VNCSIGFSIPEQLRGLIVAFFMPVFFGLAGLATDLTILAHPQLLGTTLILIAVASVGKFAGAVAGGEQGNRVKECAVASMHQELAVTLPQRR
jgi:Kef-type K+ transport system membrane component KefB